MEVSFRGIHVIDKRKKDVKYFCAEIHFLNFPFRFSVAQLLTSSTACRISRFVGHIQKSWGWHTRFEFEWTFAGILASSQNIRFCHGSRAMCSCPMNPRRQLWKVWIIKENDKNLQTLAIGRAFKRSYDEYMAFAHPTEDIFLEWKNDPLLPSPIIPKLWTNSSHSI